MNSQLIKLRPLRKHSQAPHLPQLTGLRGIAAYSVLIAHAIAFSFYYESVQEGFFIPLTTNICYCGMSLFFVLSGFVIQYNYANLIHEKGFISGGYQFLVARLARLYPLYILYIFLSLDHIPSKIFEGYSSIFLAYITMTQSWFDQEKVIFAASGWSISTEWFFYLAFLGLTFCLNDLRKPLQLLIIYLIFIPLILFLLFLIKDYYLATDLSTAINQFAWLIYRSPYIRIFEFIAGVLAAQIFTLTPLAPSTVHCATKKIRFILLLCMLWCIGICALGNYLQFTTFKSLPLSFNHLASCIYLLPNFAYTPALITITILCCRYKTFLSQFLTSKPLQLMGEISYSVYILQLFIIYGLMKSFVSQTLSTESYINSSIKCICIIALTTMIAYGSYYLYELPARKWLRKLLMASPGQPVFSLSSTSHDVESFTNDQSITESIESEN